MGPKTRSAEQGSDKQKSEGSGWSSRTRHSSARIVGQSLYSPQANRSSTQRKVLRMNQGGVATAGQLARESGPTSLARCSQLYALTVASQLKSPSSRRMDVLSIAEIAMRRNAEQYRLSLIGINWNATCWLRSSL